MLLRVSDLAPWPGPLLFQDGGCRLRGATFDPFDLDLGLRLGRVVVVMVLMQMLILRAALRESVHVRRKAVLLQLQRVDGPEGDLGFRAGTVVAFGGLRTCHATFTTTCVASWPLHGGTQTGGTAAAEISCHGARLL